MEETRRADMKMEMHENTLLIEPSEDACASTIAEIILSVNLLVALSSSFSSSTSTGRWSGNQPPAIAPNPLNCGTREQRLQATT